VCHRAADGDPGVIFKDLDLDVRIVLEQAAYEALLAQLKADCELLRWVELLRSWCRLERP